MCDSDWVIYEQNLWNDDPPPSGDGWSLIGVYGSVRHNGLRNSLGGGPEPYGVVVWARKETAKRTDHSIKEVD